MQDSHYCVRQVQLHLGMGTDPAGIVSWHKKRGIQLQAYSVLGNTAVSHKASASAEPHVPLHQQYARSKYVQMLSRHELSHLPGPEILTGNLTTSIAKAHGKSSVQVALKWVVSQGANTAC